MDGDIYAETKRTELDWNFIRKFFVVAFLLWIMRLSLNFNFFFFLLLCVCVVPTLNIFALFSTHFTSHFALVFVVFGIVCMFWVWCGAFVFRKISFCFYAGAQSFSSFFFLLLLLLVEERAFVPPYSSCTLILSLAMIPVLCDSGLLQSIRPYNNYAIWTIPFYILWLIRLERFWGAYTAQKSRLKIYINSDGEQFFKRTLQTRYAFFSLSHTHIRCLGSLSFLFDFGVFLCALFHFSRN